MIKLMIVDDEEEILKGLKNIIAAMDLGFEKICCEIDPEAAEKIICEEGYDIVISDICMDQKTGLEMIRSIKERAPDCKFVIISGYDDFVYMKDAIRLGVSEYICKPVSKTELKETLVKLIQMVELNNQEKMHECLRDLVIQGRQNVMSEEEAERALQGCFFTVVRPFGKVRMALPQSICRIQVAGCMILLGRTPLQQDLLKDFLKEGFFACSKLNMEWRGLVHARAQTERMSLYRPLYEKKGIAFYDCAEKLSVREDDVQYYLNCFEKEMSKKKRNASYVHNLLETVLSKMKDLHYLLVLKLKGRIETIIAQKCGLKLYCPDYAEFDSVSALLCEYEKNMQCEVRTNEIGIDRALEYIDAHFTENITLASLSNRVNFNYSYFSRMFKQQVGMSFIQYVTRKRMELAVELLSDPDIKVYEIARRVGYEESKHFTKTFKNYFGQSPDQFRSGNFSKSAN